MGKDHAVAGILTQPEPHPASGRDQRIRDANNLFETLQFTASRPCGSRTEFALKARYYLLLAACLGLEGIVLGRVRTQDLRHRAAPVATAQQAHPLLPLRPTAAER